MNGLLLDMLDPMRTARVDEALDLDADACVAQIARAIVQAAASAAVFTPAMTPSRTKETRLCMDDTEDWFHCSIRIHVQDPHT